MNPEAAASFFERRVPQILAIYLGASWGFIQFVSFLEDRFMLSPHWTNLTLYALAFCTPSVALFAYHHGRPGKDRWTRSERIGIPTNLVVTVAVLFFLFSGESLGAATTTVALTDENGKAIERVVPKSEFRKRLAIFYFGAEALDTTTQWLRYGAPLALAEDLSQDLFVDALCPCSFSEQLRKAGYADGLNVPISLQRKIAEELHMPHFVAGKVTSTGGQTSVTAFLYETERGKLLRERTFTGTDIFELVDQMSLQLKRDLEVPERHIETEPDLAVSEITTASVPAFRRYVAGSVAASIAQDWGAAARELEAAVALDPTFANAQYTLSGVYTLMSQADKAQGALRATMDHLYRLPERKQYGVKSSYYFLRQDPAKALAAAEMRVKLFPEDREAYQQLAQLQIMRNDKDGAIASLKRVLELDASQSDVLQQIGRLYEGKGDNVEALRYYEQYAARFPNNRKAFTALGDLHRRMGSHAQARSNFDRALLIDPSDVGTMVRLADLDRDLGEFNRALKQYREALAAAKTPADKITAYDGLQRFHDTRGQMRQAIGNMQLSMAEAATIQPPAFIALQQLSSLGMYVRAGERKTAAQILTAASAQLAPPFDAFVALGQLDMALESEDPAAAERALPGVEAVIATLGLEILRPYVAEARGRIHEMRGEFDRAITQYEMQHKLDPSDSRIFSNIGRCYRELRQPQRAREFHLKALKILPFDPRANYDLALAYLDLGNRAKALEHLERAVGVWAEADPTYERANEAKAKLAAVAGTASPK
jgi:tetratricopeptide (TPR) repeat protein